MNSTITPLLRREWFDLPADVLWLAHCKDGPVPMASMEEMQRILATELRPWELRWQEDFLDVAASARTQAAALLGAQVDDISLTTCTTTGIEAVSLGYPWQAGDEVLIPIGEFPSNRLPWLALAARGVRCTEVPLWAGHGDAMAAIPDARAEPEQALIQAMTPSTRVLAVSWVRYQDGIKLDIARLGRACRERGVHLLVDGIQGAGTQALSLDGVDAFSTGGHKGLLGLQGQGLLWTDKAFRARLLPLGTWLATPEALSQADASEPWVTDGRRLEAGSPSIASCAALAASMKMLHAAGGAAALQQHIASLQHGLLDELTTSPHWRPEVERLRGLLAADRLGSILSFALPDERCRSLMRGAEAGAIHASVREGYLRIALHGWHGGEDIPRIAAWLLQLEK